LLFSTFRLPNSIAISIALFKISFEIRPIYPLILSKSFCKPIDELSLIDITVSIIFRSFSMF
jgi:hypothetical protein